MNVVANSRELKGSKQFESLHQSILRLRER